MTTHVQYQATKQGGPLALATVPTPTPGPKEVLVQLKAIALNPLENKQIDYGVLIEKWPAVLGCDGAGVITAVGSQVSKIRVGDEVLGAFFHGTKTAAYQEIACLPESMVAKKPADLSFEDAASMPICFVTAAATLTTLKIAVPLLPGTEADETPPKSVLVLGGSSSVGAAAVQLLRLSLPNAIILATSSPKHHAHLKSLGATAAFDQNSTTLVDDIKAATPEGAGVDKMIDAVGAAAVQKNIFDAFDPAGPTLDAEVQTGAQISPPADVTRIMTGAVELLSSPQGPNTMSALSQLLAQGKYKLPIAVKVVGTGLEAIGTGLQELRAGVSGTKLVVTL